MFLNIYVYRYVNICMRHWGAEMEGVTLRAAGKWRTQTQSLITYFKKLEPVNPEPSTLFPEPSTLNPQPSTLHPPPSTLNPQSCTLNPEP